MKKKYFLIIGIVFLVLAGTKYIDYRTKLFKGYCFAEKRYLTNRELTDVVVTQLLDKLEVEFATLSVTEKENTIRYKSLSDFYSINSHCCKNWSYSPENKIARKKRLDKLRKNGLMASYGHQISGPIYYQHDKAGPAIYRRYPIRLSYCGKLFTGKTSKTIGTRISDLPGTLTFQDILNRQ